MTKRQIVKSIAHKKEISQALTREIVQRTLDSITEALERTGRIELRDFGVFLVKTRRPRKGRNPRTGEEVLVPERRVVVFKPGRLMEEKIAATAKPKPA